MGVKAGRDQHEVRGELTRGGEHDVLYERQPLILPGAAGHGEVERVALAGPRADVGERAGAGVDAGLVDAREQHVRARAEGLGGAVAVVHVPVEDEHAARAELGDRELRGDGDVVEQAEAHRTIRFGVVAGRAQRREAGARFAGEQRARQLAGAAGGVQRRAVGGLADVGVRVDRAAAARGELLDRTNQARVVDQLQPALLRGRRGAPLPPEPVLGREHTLELEQPLGRVGVRGHVHAWIVLQRGRVAEIQPRARGGGRSRRLAHRARGSRRWDLIRRSAAQSSMSVASRRSRVCSRLAEITHQLAMRR